MKKRWPAVATLVVLSLLGGACNRAKVPEAAVQAVQEGKAAIYRPDEGARYSAGLLPASQVDLTFKSPGIVQSICEVRGADGRLREIQTGDKVTRGMLLAQVRPIDYEQQTAKASAALQAAQAQLAQARANQDEAALTYERASSLYNSESLPKPQYDQAKARNDAAAAGVAAAVANVEAARTTLKQAELALQDTYLRAPITGWVLGRSLEVGGLAGNAGPGISLIDTSEVKAVFGMPDTALKLVKKGQVQQITIDALSHPVKGVVTAISPQADPKSRVFSVEVTIANPGDEMKPGMIGNLTLAREEDPPSCLVAPLSAVVRSPDKPGGYAVFRLERKGGKFMQRPKTSRSARCAGILLKSWKALPPAIRLS